MTANERRWAAGAWLVAWACTGCGASASNEGPADAAADAAGGEGSSASEPSTDAGRPGAVDATQATDGAPPADAAGVLDVTSADTSPDGPRANAGPTVFGAANSWFLHQEVSADRLAILDAAQAAHLKLIRVFVRAISQAGYVDYVSNVNNTTVNDVETSSGYDDTVLENIDQLMVEAQARGLKLVIALHDRWYLGDWEGSDIYTQSFGVSAGTQALHDFYDPDAGAAMMKQFDARLAHVLSHRNAKMGGRPWGSLGEVVFAVEAENEAMGHFANLTSDFAGAWECARARAMKPYVSNGVLIATGGVTNITDSAFPSFFQCPEIDLVGIHDYDRGGDVPTQLAKAVSLARASGKRTYVEEFSCDANLDCDGSVDCRATCNEQQIVAYEALGLPWMHWAVLTPSDAMREVFPGDPSWSVLASHATNPPKTGFAWPELP